jgi:hypothetical protein
VASLIAQGADCALQVQTLGEAERILGQLRGACPSGGSLVVHPDGTRLLLLDSTGITAIDVATAAPKRLPPISGVEAVRWDDTGAVVVLTSEPAPAPSSDTLGRFVLADGERLAVTEEPLELLLGRVHRLEGESWKVSKRVLGYAYEGMAQEQIFADTVRALVGHEPGWLGDRPRDLGVEVTDAALPPGTWRRDGNFAFQFEWLEGVMPHGPAQLALPDGTWKALPGFETGSLSWEERADVIWVSVEGGPHAVFDTATGAERWRATSAAWLLPLDVTLAASTLAGPPPPLPGGPDQMGPGVNARRAGPRGERGPRGPRGGASAEPAAAPEPEAEEAVPEYEPPPDLDTPDEREDRRRRPRRNRENREGR